jgi:DNA-binding NtrC family response regulator
MPLRVQVHLLRVLEEGVLRRVGGEDPVRVDVRVIAATHRDLRGLVREGQFREDLYFRLCGATLELPPLRDRQSDLELLVRHFLQEVGASHLAPTRETWKRLKAYSWPGNVRELRAEVQRWSVFCDRLVLPDDLSPPLQAAVDPVVPRVDVASKAGPGSRAAAPFLPLAARVAALERQAIQEALEATGGNLVQAARLLDIDRNTLKRKRLQPNLPPQSKSLHPPDRPPEAPADKEE